MASEIQYAGPTISPTTAGKVEDCAICGNLSFEVFADLGRYRVLNCPSCTTHLRDPTVVDPLDDRIGEYEARQGLFEKQTADRILSAVDEIKPVRGDCLDVGCATGSFLRQAEARGWRCHGTDISTVAVARARVAVPSGSFEAGPFSRDTFEGRTFDLITMLDVLEHMSQPFLALEAIEPKLRSNGIFVLRVPVIDSLMVWLAKLTYTATGARYRKPIDLLYRYHVIGFSTSSIRRSLEKCGFEVIRSWRENSIDPSTLQGRSWAKSVVERILTRQILFWQTALRLQDEIVVLAQKKVRH